jgi:ABC-type phosphate transport system substrate-binding protein
MRFLMMMCPSNKCLLVAALSWVLLSFAGANGFAADVAIVVSADVPVEDLSLADVRKIFLGDRQYWTSNLRVTLLVRAPVARERDVVLKKIYDMTEAQYRQYWISKVFRADVPSGPKIFYSAGMATELVGVIPGAIAFVDAAQVPPNAKVLRIDGALPGEAGYPLK